MGYLLAIFGYFIFCQIIVAKGFIPKFFKNASAFKIIFYTILLIITCAVIGAMTNTLALLLIASTIYMASVIVNKYLKIFDDMERGKRI